MIKTAFGSIAALALAACATSAPTTPMQVVVIGDSTASIYKPEDYPRMGWAMVLQCATGQGVSVVDDAKSGRSTITFQTEGWWEKSLAKLHPGDLMLIQFGHNDQVKEPVARFAAARGAFSDNLRLFVKAARDKGATPVLITPVARLAFIEGTTKARDTHGDYDNAVRDVAAELKTPLIDLTADSMALIEHVGYEPGKALYRYIAPGENPKYPDGMKDNTHFSETGARQIAGLVAKRLAALDTPLKGRIVADSPALQAGFIAKGPACSK